MNLVEKKALVIKKFCDHTIVIRIGFAKKCSEKETSYRGPYNITLELFGSLPCMFLWFWFHGF